MMKLQTLIGLPPSPSLRLSHSMELMSIGSCFSEHIGKRLALEGYRIAVNPFGVQYNPLSMARGLERLLCPTPYEADDLVLHGGLYHSLDHHGSFSRTSEQAALACINTALEQAAQQLRRASYLLLTWGTAYVYEHLERSVVVSNCHKMPERTFARRRTSLPELQSLWEKLLERLFELNPSLHIIQSVSPIRHLRDGAHESQLSKATLLLLSEALCARFRERVSYFPAYELVLDELRDYRFYAEDMIHPSEQTVRYVGDRFIEWIALPESLALMPHIARLRQEYRHRPLCPSDPETELRREQLLVRIRAFAAQHPEVNLLSWVNPDDL